MIRILIISAILISCNGNQKIDKSQILKYSVVVNSMSQETLLSNIQVKIKNAFTSCVVDKKDDELIVLINKLDKLNKLKKQNLITYWQSYAYYYASIFAFTQNDEETAEKQVDKGINLLKEIKNKNSEDYTLLAMLQGFGIQFKGMKAMFISSSIEKNLKKAIALDSTNLRARFVSGSNDFYTPEAFGGGKMTEIHLLKALSLDTQKVKNSYLPSWGEEESYEMLIKVYIKKENWELAKKYFQEATKKFSNSYTITQLGTQLVGK